MRKIFAIVVSLLMITTAPLAAEGAYYGIGLGLMPNANSLSNTIMIDGLESSIGAPVMTGASTGTGCTEFETDSSDYDTCLAEDKAVRQEILVPENKLISLDRASWGVIRSDTNGGLNALTLDAFYEYNWKNTFIRGGISYAKKVMGGSSKSSIAGINWYQLEYDYEAKWVPVWFGIKTSVNEDSQVYGAISVNYYDGYWSVKGYNVGDIPTQILGVPMGTSYARRYDAEKDEYQTVGGPLLNASLLFRGNGIGFGAMIGFETKVNDKGSKFFLEITHMFAGTQADSLTADYSTIQHMGLAHITYPFAIVGTYFSMGYKHSLGG